MHCATVLPRLLLTTQQWRLLYIPLQVLSVQRRSACMLLLAMLVSDCSSVAVGLQLMQVAALAAHHLGLNPSLYAMQNMAVVGATDVTVIYPLAWSLP